jgi:hypothetical protein
VVQLDHAAQIARVTLRANEILGMFEHEAEHNPDMKWDKKRADGPDWKLTILWTSAIRPGTPNTAGL